jgi:hypothetical protein
MYSILAGNITKNAVGRPRRRRETNTEVQNRGPVSTHMKSGIHRKHHDKPKRRGIS